jgi:phosphomannomutase
MENIYLFDVDGTLTDPRQPMTDEFSVVFWELVRSNPVYLVSGSDLEKIQEQIPEHILAKCRGIFSSSANQFDVGENLIYKNQFKASPEFIKFLEEQVENSSYKVKTGKHIEHRPGMINFSIVGRNATQEQREEYYKWDKRKQERKRLAVLTMVKFPEIDVKIGGEISIDIYPTGFDKRQSVNYLRKKDSDKRICFFGDKTNPLGNDYSVVASLTDDDKVHCVTNYRQTKDIILSYLRGESFE